MLGQITLCRCTRAHTYTHTCTHVHTHMHTHNITHTYMHVHTHNTTQHKSRAHPQDDEDGNTVFNVIESTPPPPKASDARLVLSTVLTGTAAALFDVLLASESHFMEDFLENDGNRCVNESVRWGLFSVRCLCYKSVQNSARLMCC